MWSPFYRYDDERVLKSPMPKLPPVLPPPTARLCQNCRDFDFDCLFPRCRIDSPQKIPSSDQNYDIRDFGGRLHRVRRDWHWKSEVDLGPLDELDIRATSCLCCHFIWDIARKSLQNSGKLNMATDKNLHCFIASYRFLKEVLETRAYNSSTFNLSGMDISVNDMTKRKRGDYSVLVSTSVRLGSSATSKDLSHPGRVATYSGRYRPAYCDMKLIKAWISLCDSGHHECQSSTTGLRGSLRLIDVNQECLVDVLWGQGVPYFALSYTWGRQRQQLILTKENMSSLYATRGIKNPSRTIRDAMDLVKKLSERYLWVDAICIIQDDAVDKAVHIPLIKAIYSRSFLTIIAAAGQDADAALPGITKGRMEPRVVDLGTFSLFEPTCHFGNWESPLNKTFWATRAWTLQEQLLSRRCLIFLENHIYWMCRTATWHEDIELEQNGSRVQKDTHDIDLSMAHYIKIVENYSKRQLTYDTDFCDAFAGITDALPEEFIWGIPHFKFEEYLQWSAIKHADRPQLIWRNMPLAPSWSWMAWKGDIYMDSVRDCPRPEIACYQNGTAKGCVLRKISNINLPPDALIQDTKCTLSDLPRDVKLEQSHLVFWASSAILWVTKNLCREAGYYSLSKGRGSWPVGSFFTDLTQDFTESGSWHEVLVTSSFLKNRSSGCVIMSPKPMFGVMLISRHNDIAYRKALGSVEREAWLNAHPIRKLIILG